MSIQNTNLETLKVSLNKLKNKILKETISDNKFAAQNKEYVIGLLKSIA